MKDVRTLVKQFVQTFRVGKYSNPMLGEVQHLPPSALNFPRPDPEEWKEG